MPGTLLVLTLSALAQQLPPESPRHVEALRPPEIVSLLRERGDRTTTRHEGGVTIIDAEHEGLRYAVVFYDCDPSGDCLSMQFRTWFSFGRPLPRELLDAWNRDKRLGTAYRDEDGRPSLDLDVWVAGGVTWAWLQGRRDWFFKSAAAYRDWLAGQLP